MENIEQQLAEHTSAIDDTAARITALEFALEIMWATQLAHTHPEQSAQVKEQYVAAMARPYGPLTSDPAQAHRMRGMSLAAAKHAANLAMKVWRHENQLRAQTTQAPTRRPNME